MKILFRVDCNNKVGSGHLSRCYTLYKALKNKGYKVYFLTNNFNKIFFNKKIERLINYNSKSFSQNIDMKNTLKIIKNKKINTLILDHYLIKKNWCQSIKKKINNFIIIDDGFKKNYKSDLYINFTDLKKKKKNSDKKLTGLKYVILNSDYYKKKRNYFINKYDLFINFGTGNNEKYIKILIELLNDIKAISKVVIIGNYRNLLNKIKFKLNYKISFIKNFERLDRIINNSKICLGAGGINLLERLFLKKKNIVFACAKHQISLCKNLKGINNIKYFGEIDILKNKTIREKLKKEIKLMLKEKKSQKKIIDDFGPYRIIKKIEEINNLNNNE